MELNREQQIIRAYECCHSILLGCSDCPFINDSKECADTDRNVLAILMSQEQKIKELTEENEKLKAQRYYLHSDGRIEMIPTVESVRTDTVRKMQERLKARNEVYCINKADLKTMNFVVDQIAKEMLEGENEN